MPGRRPKCRPRGFDAQADFNRRAGSSWISYVICRHCDVTPDSGPLLTSSGGSPSVLHRRPHVSVRSDGSREPSGGA